MTVYQPVPQPRTPAEYERVKDQLVDLAGRPLQRHACTACNGLTSVGEVCPMSLRCRSCLAEPGNRCTRPSEHATFNGELHRDRLDDAEAATTANAAAGITTIPAQWAPPAPVLF